MIGKAFDVSKFCSAIRTSFIGVFLSQFGVCITTKWVICGSNLETVFHVLQSVFKSIGGANILWKKADDGVFVVGAIEPAAIQSLPVCLQW